MRVEINLIKEATAREIDRLVTELNHNEIVETTRLIHHSTVLPIPREDRKILSIKQSEHPNPIKHDQWVRLDPNENLIYKDLRE